MKHYEHTKEEAITLLKQFVSQNNRLPKWVDCKIAKGMFSTNALKHFNGSLTQAIVSAGFLPKYPCTRKKWDKHTITASLKHYYEVHSKVPTPHDLRTCMDREQYPTPAIVRNYYHTWHLALIAAALIKRRSKLLDYILQRTFLILKRLDRWNMIAEDRRKVRSVFEVGSKGGLK